jgi:hypothetical protein
MANVYLGKASAWNNAEGTPWRRLPRLTICQHAVVENRQE